MYVCSNKKIWSATKILYIVYLDHSQRDKEDDERLCVKSVVECLPVSQPPYEPGLVAPADGDGHGQAHVANEGATLDRNVLKGCMVEK